MARSAIIKDTIAYSASTLVIQNITFFLAVYTRNVLGPEAIGVWVLLQVFLNYAAYGNLGMLNAVCREIPILKGQGGKDQKIKTIKNVGFTYIAGVSFLTASAAVVGALIWKHQLSDLLFYGLLSAAVITILQRMNSYLVQLLHVEKQFVFVSKFKIYSALVNAFLVIVLTWQWKLYGFYVASIISYFFNIFYLYALGSFHFEFLWDKREMEKLLKFGTPLLILTAVVTVLSSIDKISIGKFLGLKDLGIYSIATMAGNYIFMLPTMFQTVLYPRTLEKFGNVKDTGGRIKYSVLPGKLMSIYFALCIGLIWISAPILCRLFMPKYVQGLTSLKILLFGYCFLALAQQLFHILLGYGKHLLMLPVSIILLLGGFGVNFVLVQNGYGITSIAVSMTTILVINYLTSAYLALKPIYKINGLARQVLLTLIPIVFCYLVLSGLDFIWPDQSSIAGALLKGVIYSLLWAGLLFSMENQLGAFRTFKEVFSNWKNKAGKTAIPVDLLTVEE